MTGAPARWSPHSPRLHRTVSQGGPRALLATSPAGHESTFAPATLPSGEDAHLPFHLAAPAIRTLGLFRGVHRASQVLKRMAAFPAHIFVNRHLTASYRRQLHPDPRTSERTHSIGTTRRARKFTRHPGKAPCPASNQAVRNCSGSRVRSLRRNASIWDFSEGESPPRP